MEKEFPKIHARCECFDKATKVIVIDLELDQKRDIDMRYFFVFMIERNPIYMAARPIFPTFPLRKQTIWSTEKAYKKPLKN